VRLMQIDFLGLGFRPKLPWLAMSGICLGRTHHVTAIILAIPAIGATNHLVMSLDEFLFLQVYSPRIRSRHEFYVPVSSHHGTHHNVSWCSGVEAAEFKVFVFGKVRYLNDVLNDAARGTFFFVFNNQNNLRLSVIQRAEFRVSSLV
jgi:hypothetical protein